MAALVKFSRPGGTKVPQVLGAAYISKRSKSNEVTLQNYKRGTGGRSSFSGIVATVFGSTGFLGRYVVNKLGKRGSQIIIPYRNDEYSLNHLKVMGDIGQILYQPFHLCDEESIRKSVQYSNVVINLIGRDRETKNFKFEDVHVAGAARIARIAKEAGVQDFIHLSAMNAANPQSLRVFNPDTGSQYLTTKYDGELAVKEHFPEATILRPGHMVGEEDRFVRYYIDRTYRRRMELTLWAEGRKTVKRPIKTSYILPNNFHPGSSECEGYITNAPAAGAFMFQYMTRPSPTGSMVTDVSNAVYNCINNPDAKGKTFELVGHEAYTLHDIVMYLFSVISYSNPPKISDVSKGFLLETQLREKYYLKPTYRLDTLDRYHVSDILTPGLGTIEDLGITTEPLLDYMEWLARPFSDHRYYWDTRHLPKPEKPHQFSETVNW